MLAGDGVTLSVSKTVYDGFRAYDIVSDGRVHAMFPVSDNNTKLYHIVNVDPVEMASVLVLREDGSMLLEADLSSYSVYYVTEEPDEEPGKYDPCHHHRRTGIPPAPYYCDSKVDFQL